MLQDTEWEWREGQWAASWVYYSKMYAKGISKDK